MQEVQTTLPIGSIVGGRYLVEELLGKGGFGAVYLVRDQRVRQNLFALKEVIDPNKQERKRFVFEADLLRRLDHPALPRVYHVFEDDKNERAYMLMDYVEGSNLEVLRRRQPNKRFALPQVLSIMEPIFNALSYLHNHQPPIIHRDIKPANIIVPPSGNEAMLVDFGIAKEFDPDSTTTAVRHASPGYAAPEQYGVGTNTRTDIYGLGATIYTLLTGVVPADSFYRTTQLGSKGYDSLESILKFAPNVPQHITDAIYRAMAVDINDRFPTVQDFWQELNAQSVEDYHSPVPVVLSKSTAAPAHPAAMITPILPIHDETTFVMERHPQKRRRVGVLLLLLLFALLAGIATALVLPFIEGNRSAQTSTRSTVTVVHTPISKIRHKVTPVATPRITHTPIATQPSPPPLSPVPAGYPGVNGTYNGTIIDFHGNIKNNMSLTIQQNQANISGNFIVIGGLSGSGPFTGSVTNNSNIQFTVRSSGINPLSFTGTVQANGYMMGNYCSLNSNGQCDPNAGGYGTWDVLRVASGSGS